MVTPSVSIVMPCYNAAAHLARSVGSVQAQTVPDWELVVVDDGSIDASCDQVRQLAAIDPRIRFFHQDHAGAATARNRALAESRASYTAFLDADDTWHPEFLETMLRALAEDSTAAIAYCGWQNLGLGNGRDAPFVPPDYENRTKTELLLGGCRWPIHAALVRSRAIHDCGGFDETLTSCMDYDLWLRLGTAHRLVRVPRVLAYYHHHGGGQITQNRPRVALNHWRAQQKFLRANPEVVVEIGRKRVRELTDGELLKRGYACYWKRNLPAARQIFRHVMRQGYGTLNDWKYMLPSWLPESWHRLLVWLQNVRRGEADG